MTLLVYIRLKWFLMENRTQFLDPSVENHKKDKIMTEKIMDERVVSKEPVFESCWISYLGAVSGVLKSMGKDYSIVDVGGYTGYAFWTNTNREYTCPSAPTAYGKDIGKEIHQNGMKSFGVRSHWVVYEEGGLPIGDMLPIYDQLALDLFGKIKEEIIRDNPVILWGIPVPEWGIVKGYRDQSYQVSTFRHLNNIPDDPIKYNELQARGMIAAQTLIAIEEEVAEHEIDKKAIERAIFIAEGPLPKWMAETYVAGPRAFGVWAEVLEKGSENPYMGNSYVGGCTHEAKLIAAQFLENLAEKYENKPQAKFLSLASQAYRKVESLLKEFTELFPFALEGEMSKDSCLKGAQILRSAEKPELEGIKHLKAANTEKWV